MPIYEYRCLECGKKFEKLVPSMSVSVAIECPKCGGRKVKKLLSAFGVQISGSASDFTCPTCKALDR
jgi:putative FmdB family regulatory protein